MTAGHTRSDVQHFLSVDQLSAPDILALLERAKACGENASAERRDFSATLLMLQPSLRTHLGFAEATRRLGGVAHAISARRELASGSANESLADTLRVITGMTDVAVVRASGVLADHVAQCRSPIINAGDDLEHPTQALIDLFAIQQLCGPWENLCIGICGDLNMRATRSLCKALAIVPPRRIWLMAPATRRGDAEALLRPIADRIEWGEGGAWDGLDALYLSGLPERRGSNALGAAERARYALTEQNIAALSEGARVFSPMPVIDEISDALRDDARVAIYRQSELGVAVRMAVLLRALGAG